MISQNETQLYYEQICRGEVSNSRLVYNEDGPFYLRVDARNYRTDYQIATAVAE